MPGWYERTKGHVATGKLAVHGLIQEQHPDRTSLFNQWKKMKLPLLVDPLNQIDVTAVPITLLVDEHGVVRYRNPSPDDLEKFLAEEPAEKPAVGPKIPGTQWSAIDALALTGKHSEAIAAYAKAIRAKSKDAARLHFRLGVTYRMRYDSGEKGGRQPDDFSNAVKHWTTALKLNPNQYIWRRRIQQYGPVLDKPYPFYNWVAEARKAIVARGEKPVVLAVEPAGAELVGPRGEKGKPAQTAKVESPDPDGKITRDVENAISFRTVIVPATGKTKKAARVHLVFEPNPLSGYSWNNESEPLQVWIEGKRNELLEMGNPNVATSSEPRELEFELMTTETEGNAIKGYALYSICHKKSGVCSYRRQDLEITVK